ncbi:glycosyltransferase family 4 protein [Chitinophaga arvensicola]|uniref:Glycosyltransferase involved in cell wall bisynthesis n=1 Tax=Chitinophaga arvensicola TaxID=29529 RepID=A0A1I0S7Z7_9BACT|nr:glycosyltransferase family 4 protein [Chitinophaga arvensicola]SEW51978.1 Glycosyltransferase involved in cell wall bisynthesis [Chitinophaga arvensicola]
MAVKKAILISFNGKSSAGGVERIVYFLDEYFRRKGIPSKIIDEQYLIHHTLFGRLFQQLFRYRHFKKRKTIYLACYASAFLWWYKRSSHVVISQGESVPFYPVDFAYLHGSYHCMEIAYGRTDPRLSRIAALQQRSCLIAKQVIAVTTQVKQDLIDYYQVPSDKIVVLDNCVDTARFAPVEKKPGTRRTLLFVGRLVREKGLPALQQLAGIIAKSDNWQLLIACNESPDTAFFADIPHTIVKTGLSIDNIAAEAYGMADLLILPSLFESFGLVVLEALSMGVPVIGTDVGAIVELGKRHFPGVYRLPELAYDDPEMLVYFDNIVTAFNESAASKTLHQQVAAEFDMEGYYKKLDAIMAPAFAHKS